MITELAERGLGDQTIMSIAGHVSRQMLDHYSHIRTDAKRQAVKCLETRSRLSDATPPIVPPADSPIQDPYVTIHVTNALSRESEQSEVVDSESGRMDSNHRPPAPKAGALTRLRYAPC